MKKLIAKEFIKNNMTSTFVSMTDYIELQNIDGNVKEIDYTEKVKFYEDNNYKVICEIESSGVIGKGVSRCHPDDRFDLMLGMTIAMGRAKSDLYKKITKEFINSL